MWGVVSTEGVPLPSAMDGITNTAMSAFGDWDWLVVFEDDIIPPSDAFLRIIGYDEDVDIVGSMNFMHEPPHYVNAYPEQHAGGADLPECDAGCVAGMVGIG